MNPYFARIGDEEWGVLALAHTAREARRLAYPELRSMGDADWSDVRVKLIIPPEHAMAQADQEKLARGEAHVMDSWDGCLLCGEPMGDAEYCQRCRGDEQ